MLVEKAILESDRSYAKLEDLQGYCGSHLKANARRIYRKLNFSIELEL